MNIGERFKYQDKILIYVGRKINNLYSFTIDNKIFYFDKEQLKEMNIWTYPNKSQLK